MRIVNWFIISIALKNLEYLMHSIQNVAGQLRNLGTIKKIARNFQYFSKETASQKFEHQLNGQNRE